jgi:5-methylcytosine-specific restriction endonuclease McrA
MSRVPDSVRRVVQQRAAGRCEYCHLPESESPYTFHVDHIVARKHGGSSKPENLAWACFSCNSLKGPDVATYDEDAGDLVPLFNPRTQHWDQHFQMEGAMIEGRTAIGRATVKLLQLNHTEQIEARAALIQSGLW